MVRPFACLVAMGWRQRKALAQSLGFSLFESAVFGDAHAEAWELLSRDGCGVQSRASKAHEARPALPRSWVVFDC